MSDRKRNWLLFGLGLCVHTLLVGHLDWYWGWLSALLLLGAVGYGFKQNVLSVPSTIREETIGQIIDSLPDSLSVGTQSHREVLQRVLHMWEEFETMTLILDRILEGVVLVSSSGEVLLVNQRASNLISVQPHQDNVRDYRISSYGAIFYRNRIVQEDGDESTAAVCRDTPV